MFQKFQLILALLMGLCSSDSRVLTPVPVRNLAYDPFGCTENFYYSLYLSVYASGTVYNLEGSPLNGASVELRINGSYVNSTSASGSYSLYGSAYQSGYIFCPFNSISVSIELCASAPEAISSCRSQSISYDIYSSSQSESTSLWENFYLEVPPPPPSPVGLVAEAIAPTQIAMKWSSGGGSTSYYSVAYQAGSEAPENCRGGTAVVKTSYEVKNLLPESVYSFRVCALNAAGVVSSESITTTAETLTAQYSTSMSLVRLTRRSVVISLSRDSNSPADSVLIQICREGTTRCSTLKKAFAEGVSSITFSLRRLARRRMYRVTAIPILGNRSEISFTTPR